MPSLTLFLVIAVCVAAPLMLIYVQLRKMTPGVQPRNLDHEAAKHRLILNAYERLSLLCERIQPDKLAQRLQSPQLSAAALSRSMIIAIHQEFDHNITQQIYVSDELWNIITIAKDEAMYDIIQMTSTLPPDTLSQDLTQLLMQYKDQSKLNLALQAIRKEAKQYVKI